MAFLHPAHLSLGLLLTLGASLGAAMHMSEHFFVRISDGDRAFTSGTVTDTKLLSSIIECSFECFKMPNCASYNVKEEVSGEANCEFLSDIPLSPEKDLSSDPGRQYFEKTCQPHLRPTLATEYEEDNSGFFSDRIYIGADNGRNVYLLYLTPTHDIVNMTFDGSVDNNTYGAFQQILGMTSVLLDPGDNHRLLVHILDTGIMCLNKTGHVSLPCFTDQIVSKSSLFGTEDVHALLATPDMSGIYAFGYSQITVVDVPNVDWWDPWTITNTIDLTPGNRPAGWANIPRGIVGAAWLVELNGNVSSKAFLLTNHFYVVYDFSTDNVLKRGHLCPP